MFSRVGLSAVSWPETGFSSPVDRRSVASKDPSGLTLPNWNRAICFPLFVERDVEDLRRKILWNHAVPPFTCAGGCWLALFRTILLPLGETC